MPVPKSSAVGVLAALMLPAAACHRPRPASVDAARAVCDMDPGEYFWQETFYQGEGPGPVLSTEPDYVSYLWVPISEACIAHLGEDIGVDWSDWPDGPGAIEVFVPNGVLPYVTELLVGLHALLAADLGTVGDELERDDRPEALTADLEMYLDRGWLLPEDNLSAAMYMWLTDKIQRTIGHEPWEGHTQYLAMRRRLEIVSWSDPFENATTPYGRVPLLFHEAGHAYSHHDVSDTRCSHFTGHVRKCDVDADGALGVAGWAGHRFYLGSAEIRAEREAAADSGDPLPWGLQSGSAINFYSPVREACHGVTDLSTMSYCFDPEVQGWAFFDLEERNDQYLYPW